MSIPTKIKWRDFIKTVEKIANANFGKYYIISKKGSARRIELFKSEKDKIPCDFLVVHEDKVIWSDDLKKTCKALKVTKEQFLEVLNNL